MRYNHPLFLLNLILLLIACKGQNSPKAANLPLLNQTALTAFGDTVDQLGANIMVVYQDKKNNYWFGSWEDGLYRYDHSASLMAGGKTLIHYTTKHGLPGNRVEEIREDKFGNVYINTSGGLCKFDGQQFTPIIESKLFYNGWKLTPDDLWFKVAGYGGEVYRLDLSADKAGGNNLYRLKLPTTKPAEDYIKKNPSTVIPYGVYCVYRDRKGAVWFGTAVSGTCRYNGIDFDWITEDDVTEFHNGPSNGVRSILEDKDGYFWFNSKYRYEVFDKAQPASAFYKKHEGVGSLDGKADGDFHEYLSIAKDNDDRIWIAGYNNGVWRYDGKDVTHFPVLVDSKQITLFYIYKDNGGKIWLGTHENGAYYFVGEGFKKFKL
jgi:ligand-binding sensor domain-containing protein